MTTYTYHWCANCQHLAIDHIDGVCAHTGDELGLAPPCGCHKYKERITVEEEAEA